MIDAGRKRLLRKRAGNRLPGHFRHCLRLSTICARVDKAAAPRGAVIAETLREKLHRLTPAEWQQRLHALEHDPKLPVKVRGNVLHAAAVGYLSETLQQVSYGPGRHKLLIDVLSRTEVGALVSVLLVWAEDYTKGRLCDTELPYRSSVWR